MERTELEKMWPRVQQDIKNLDDNTNVGYISRYYANRGAAITMGSLFDMAKRAQELAEQNRIYAEFYENMSGKYRDTLQDLLTKYHQLEEENKRLKLETEVMRKTINNLDDIQAEHDAIQNMALAMACESIRRCPMTHIVPGPEEVTKNNPWVKAFMMQATQAQTKPATQAQTAQVTEG